MEGIYAEMSWSLYAAAYPGWMSLQEGVFACVYVCMQLPDMMNVAFSTAWLDGTACG